MKASALTQAEQLVYNAIISQQVELIKPVQCLVDVLKRHPDLIHMEIVRVFVASFKFKHDHITFY